MPELPEISVIAKQMNREITGKCILEIEVKQPKTLNMPVPQFIETAKGKTVSNVTSKGKWIFVKLDPGHLMLINLGMGAELLYFTLGTELPEKYQFKLIFSDNTGFTIHFSWFGYIHLLPERDLAKHKQTAKLGISPLGEQFTLEHFRKLLGKRKAGIKSFLVNQKNIAGIGNVYIQDMLFTAGLHPNRKISTLSEEEINDLYNAIQKILSHSIQLGGLAYETDFHGQKGRFTMDEFLVGYNISAQGVKC